MRLSDIGLDGKQSKLLMELAYESIIEDIYERTERILRYHYGVKDIKKPFVPPTIWGQPILLPRNKLSRSLGTDVWGRRAELIEKEYKRDVTRLAELIIIVEKLEKWFADEKDKAMTESVNAFLGATKKVRKRP
jgi:hypothetical protein